MFKFSLCNTIILLSPQISLYWFILVGLRKRNFCLGKSRSNPFLEPTILSNAGKSFLLKATMGAFDGTWTHNWQAFANYESDALPTAPRHPLPQIK